MVTNVDAKSKYDRLRIDKTKALGFRKSDNNNNSKKNVRSDYIGTPFRVQKFTNYTET